jgi:hypothetical protein
MSTLALLAVLAGPAVADFQQGLDAYQRGDMAAALQAWLPDAERSDANAQYNVGLIYARGGEGVPRDYLRAAEWYRKAAEQGVATAQFNLGVLYATGQGVEKDLVKALDLYKKSAEQGLIDAANNLGAMYDQGEGTEKNPAEAEKWYMYAAGRGMPKAQFNLGLMYDMNKDYARALDWYRRAASQGNAPAMKNLGILLYNAQGTTRNLEEAYAWFARAGLLGYEMAGQLARATAKRMTPEEVRRAQSLAAAWRPTREAYDQSPAVSSPVSVPAAIVAPAAAPVDQQ